MPDIRHEFPIDAPAGTVFDAVSTPEGLDQWWTQTSTGSPELGSTYDLSFGPGYAWQGIVQRAVPNTEFELQIVTDDPDWRDTKVGFVLEETEGRTTVRFHNTGWPEENDHFRVSTYCWAMYLRILKRYLEHGERVPYEDRLNV